MQRDEAIRRFGHHFTIDADSHTVYETLGEADDESDCHYETLDAALEALDEEVREIAEDRVYNIDRFLGRWAVKAHIWLAKAGRLRNADSILADYRTRYLDKRSAAQELAGNGVRASCKIEHLPADIRMPVPLDLGHKIYRLQFSSHMNRGNGYEEGLKINDEQVITGRSLQHAGGCPGTHRYDYRFYYHVGKPGAARADFGFYHDHDDVSTTEIETNYSNTRYFLTREAAEDAALAMIGTLKRNFNELAGDIRERRIEERLAASARHYALDL